jgi:2-polyprenyl-3-methyl-5-hydroxy-6-metoxy-1,4-benzoquinol methylase
MIFFRTRMDPRAQSDAAPTHSGGAPLKYTTLSVDPDESHMLALGLLGDAKRIVEIGAATGYFTAAATSRGMTVVGIEPDARAVAAAHAKGVHLRLGTAESALRPDELFDCAVLLDVVEHVPDADGLLACCLRHLRPHGELVLSVPNVAHWKVRSALLRGQFDYTATGIMDDTHIHFYTAKTLEELLTRHGLHITQKRYSSGLYAYRPLPSEELQWQRRKLIRHAVSLWPELFAYQFVWKATRA